MLKFPLDLADLQRAKNQLADLINWIESSRHNPAWPQPTMEEIERKVSLARADQESFLVTLRK